MDAGSGKTPSSVPRNLALIIFSFFLYPSDTFASFIEWAFNASATSSAFLLHFPSEDVCIPLSWRKVPNHGNFWRWMYCWFLSLSSSDVVMSTMIISIYCLLDETTILYWKNNNSPRKQCQLEDINNQSSIRMSYSPRSLASVLELRFQSLTLKYIEIGLLQWQW